jgi:hypothetical protein
MGRHPFVACLFLLVSPALVRSEEPFRFPEATHGKGELKYVKDIPILTLAGKPEEIGEQLGVLALKPAAPKVATFKKVLKEHGLDLIMPLVVKFGEAQFKKWPENYRKEFEAMVKAGGVDRDLMLIASTFSDLRNLAQCSALMIGPERSKTGNALMGRNLDYPPVPRMGDYEMIIVIRADGKKPIAMVGFPVSTILSCRMSGFNADGLALGGDDVGQSSDKAPQVEWKNIPTAVVMRRALEECSTIAEVGEFVRDNRPIERFGIMACDKKGGSVIEVTSKNVVRRGEGEDICYGTNCFLSKQLKLDKVDCNRAFLLAQAGDLKKLGVEEVAKKMAEVNQGKWTIHTWVFEPKTLKLHVAFGDGEKSATEFKLKEIELGKWLKR